MNLENLPIFESSDEEETLTRPLRRATKVSKERKNYFEELEEKEFFQRFRLRKNTCRMILEKIQDQIRSKTEQNQAISPTTKFLLALRFFATGSMLIVVGDFAGVSKASACVIVTQVSHAIACLSSQYINMPVTEQEKREVAENFYKIARFPCIIGAIDCTHVRLQSPGGNNAETFRNRKGYFSWNVQVVSDAELRIRNIVVSWPGCTHDSHIFNTSRIKADFAAGNMGNFILLGDSGYGNTNYLLTPLGEVRTAAQNLYNESHIRTRNTVERCFGVWKRRFPILSTGMKVSLQNSQAIIVATVVLHNIAVEENNEEIELEQTHEEVNDFENDVHFENNLNNLRRNDLVFNYFSNLL